jgi:tricarballylate dehydrogenase
MRREYDVVVVGCGIAGVSAGLRAAELGAEVAILEKSPERHRGGQTRFSESFRVPSAVTDLSEHGYEFAFPDYTPDDFYDDIMSRTNGRADPDLARAVVDRAGPTVEWLTDRGAEWDMEPLAVGYVAGRTWCDGDELVGTLLAAATDEGADVHYEAAARELVRDDDARVAGLVADVGDERVRFDCDAVVLASGGYESSSEKRARYYGPGYDDMKVRGSRYNSGGAIDMAIDAGANPVGQWSGAHMAIIDAGSPDVEGGANRVDGYQYGVIINRDGERFLDEGEDARAHTYAKFGREIFEQPGHVAYIVLDSRMNEHARATGPSEPTVADSPAALFDAVDVDAATAEETLAAYNAACDPGEFDPAVLDGNATDAALDPPKSNWAVPLDEPPYYAYPVTGGITFAFGGVEVTPSAEVVDDRGRVVPGFYAAGNCTGGLFYDNYPGGTGLTNAAVFGKTAAETAVERLE